MILFFALCRTQGQISPGDLSNAHAALEGMSNCTQCHLLGDRVTNEKCLQCHQLLAQRINGKNGFHASVEVFGKNCFSCHSEHHGRNFNMIRFEVDDFDHGLTGYTLEGAHQNLDCKKCHNDENIVDFKVKELSSTYLGLTRECLACHEDYHKNTLSPKCTQCHTYTAFENAEKFQHNTNTSFALRGRHAGVDCKSCHQQPSGSEWDFRVQEFDRCKSCHDDVHQGRMGTSCEGCHTEEGFSPLKIPTFFNHALTGYTLEGAHTNLACKSCHRTVGRDEAFADFRGVQVGCLSCHDDHHEGRFGTNCTDCHTQATWRVEGVQKGFDHNLTAFPLEGRHLAVQCNQCHLGSFTTPLVHDQCVSCHEDHHDGQILDENRQVKDCAQCHRVQGFNEVIFDVDDHNGTNFPLTGAHLATPCFACHLREDKWVYDRLGDRCVDCHENIHEGFIQPPFLVDNQCQQCHTTQWWSDISFDHQRTDFELKGRHQEVDCRDCHFEETNNVWVQTFVGMSQECASCHKDPHRDQFVVGDKTNCENCHQEQAWKPSLFDHDSARFILDGAHKGVSCNECHVQKQDAQGYYILYKIDKLECTDCHG